MNNILIVRRCVSGSENLSSRKSNKGAMFRNGANRVLVSVSGSDFILILCLHRYAVVGGLTHDNIIRVHGEIIT